jgi:hypothetical protein
VSRIEACARFGCGSLANTFLPVRGGDVVRLSLFGRVVPGGMIVVAGAVAAFSVMRWLMLVPLAGAALPPEAFVVPAAGAAVALVLARKRRLSTWQYAKASAFAATSLGARVAGVTLVTGSFSAALLVVPALELAGVVSVTPANLGVAEGAARARPADEQRRDNRSRSPWRGDGCERRLRQHGRGLAPSPPETSSAPSARGAVVRGDAEGSARPYARPAETMGGGRVTVR